jgi:shikimate dehydrogenase
MLELSKNKGCRIIHGREMLVNQGAKQFEIWTGREAPILLMRRAMRKWLAI